MFAAYRLVFGAAIAAAAATAQAHPGHHGANPFGELAHLIGHVVQFMLPSLGFPGQAAAVLSALVVLLLAALGLGLRLANRRRHAEDRFVLLKPAD